MKEPYLTDALMQDIDALNKIITQTNNVVEGNLFYSHMDNSFKLNDNYKDKRNNFVNFIKEGKDILEIGFNAGHSAALSLHTNPNIRYTGIDICYHDYTKLCAKYLIDKFDNFVDLCIGDSKELLNKIPYKYDRIHIDGDHSYYGAKTDLTGCFDLITNDGLILVDDFDFPEVKQAVLDTQKVMYKIQLKGEKYVVLKKV